jgi:hypothetical protein
MQFIKYFLVTVAVLMGSAAMLNYFVDPAGIFFASETLEYAMAKGLADNNAVAIPGNYDERKFQKYRIELETHYQPAVLVVGSSRVMQISIKTYPEKVFNLGVSGATIEDDIALVFMSLKKFPVKKVILGIDPWVLSGSSGQDRWLTLDKEFYEAEAILLPGRQAPRTLFDKQWEKWAQLLNLDYTSESFKKLKQLSRLVGDQAPVETSDNDTPLQKVDKIRKDGSRVYRLNYAARTQQEVDNDIDLWVHYTLEGFKYSEANMHLLSVYIDYLLQHHYEVEIFLPPYHPDAYAKIKVGTPEVLMVEENLRKLAKEKHINFVGSYDPNVTHCTRYEFFDGAHPREECIQKIYGK